MRVPRVRRTFPRAAPVLPSEVKGCDQELGAIDLPIVGAPELRGCLGFALLTTKTHRAAEIDSAQPCSPVLAPKDDLSVRDCTQLAGQASWKRRGMTRPFADR